MVSAGHAHSLALTSDGVVLSWGSGAGGRLGLGDDDDRSIPSMVNGMSPVDIVSAGFDFTVAVCRSNKAVDEGTKVEPEIYVWGCGKDGRLGMGSEDTYFSPVTLTTAHGTGMEGVAVVSSGTIQRVVIAETCGPAERPAAPPAPPAPTFECATRCFLHCFLSLSDTLAAT